MTSIVDNGEKEGQQRRRRQEKLVRKNGERDATQWDKQIQQHEAKILTTKTTRGG